MTKDSFFILWQTRGNSYLIENSLDENQNVFRRSIKRRQHVTEEQNDRPTINFNEN